MARQKCNRKKKSQHKISTSLEIQPTNNARTTTEIPPIRNPPTNAQNQPLVNQTRFRKDLLYRKMMTYYQNTSNFTNRIQNFTNNGSYKIIMAGVAFCVLCWLSTYIIPSYLHVYDNAMVYKYKKDLLDDLKEYDMPNFFNNTHVFYVLKQEFVHDRYRKLIDFFREEINDIDINYKAIDNFLLDCLTMNIFSTCLVFFLNLPWWCNAISLICQIISRIIKYEPTLFFLNCTFTINYCVPWILLIVHVVNLLFVSHSVVD